VNLFAKFKSRFTDKMEPKNLRRGNQGELEARKCLQKQGTKFLTANFSTDDDCLVFVEVKTRSSGWSRPAAAVNASKRLRLTRCAFDYLRLLKNPPIKIRFDIVEVLLEDEQVVEVRHLPNTFTLTAPYRYG
jgi:putative endonuclease